MKLKVLIITSLIFFFTSCAEKEFVGKEIYVEFNDLINATIPYKDINGLIVAQVGINESGPLNFIIDTGAPETFVFLSERSKLYNKPMNDTATIKTHTKKIQSEKVKFSDELELNIANVTLKDLSIGEWPAKFFFANSSYENILFDGIIGYDLLRFVALEINRKNKTITLHKPDTYANKASVDGWTNSPIILKSKDPYCNVSMLISPDSNPIDLSLHLDLGNMGPIWVKTNKEKGIIPPAGKEQLIGQWLNGSVQKGIMWPIHELKIFNQKLKSIPTKFIPKGHPWQKNVPGFIGVRELKYFDLVIDYTNNNIAARMIEKQIVLDEEILNLYTGNFISEDLPLAVNLYVKGGLLYIEAEGQDSFPLINSSLSKFEFEPMELSIQFPENKDGVIDYSVFELEQKGARFSYKRQQ